MGLLLKQMGVLLTEDTGKEEVLHAFFASIFTAEASSQESQTSGLREDFWKKEDFPMVKEGWECCEDTLHHL